MKKRTYLWLGTIAVATALTGCIPADTGSPSSAGNNASATNNSSSPSNPSTGNVDVQFLDGLSGQPDTKRGGHYYETVEFNAPGFDRTKSLEVFKKTLYPHLQKSGCVACHNSQGLGQRPYHSDSDPEVAHEAALTKINPYDPETSRFVERLKIDRHNCPGSSCATAAADMLTAVKGWVDGIKNMLPSDESFRKVPKSTNISTAEVEQWINNDKQSLASNDRDYTVYTSLHELHNEGLSGYQLNLVRMALSKTLNTNARWAPALVHPADVNGKGILYKFDIRDYWGYNKGVTELKFGGSDDDLAFGNGKRDYRGNTVNAQVQSQKYNYSRNISQDPVHAMRVWERVLHGNVEGAAFSGTIPPYIDGFKATSLSTNAAGEYIKPENLKWVEASQLIYTLTHPDVYNGINALAMYADEFEREIGLDNSKGADSYDYILVKDAITVDSRLLFRGGTPNGYFYKSFDVFSGQLASGRDRSIYDIYADADGKDIRFPFWANPIPKFVQWKSTGDDNTHFTHIASLNQALTSGSFGGFIDQNTPGCDPTTSFAGGTFKNCRHFTGKGGFMQAAAEIIYHLPNGLQGYYLTGGENQRRVDAFTNIVRDPRVLTNGGDNMASQTGFSYSCNGGTCSNRTRDGDPRLNIGHSCIGCHADGMNRMTNDLRIGLDGNPGILPKGKYGVDGWINDSSTVNRVKELYPSNDWWQDRVEADRKAYLETIGKIKEAMFIGDDKNAYGEPIVWTAEYVQRVKYKYAQTRSN